MIHRTRVEPVFGMGVAYDSLNWDSRKLARAEKRRVFYKRGVQWFKSLVWRWLAFRPH